MKQAYRFLAKHLPFAFVGAIFSAIIGTIAMKLGYDPVTSKLQPFGVCTILFVLAILGSIIFSFVTTYKSKEMHIVRIKKKVDFLRVASIVAFIMIFFMFALETRKLILASYTENFSSFFSTWRVLKYIFAFPASFHFLLMAIPSKTRRNKKIKIPKVISYICSIGIIFWCIFGLLAVYNYDQLSITNTLVIWQLLIYLTFIIFFLFEAKFDLLNAGKKSAKGFIFTGCLAFITGISLSLTTTACMIFRIIKSEYNNSFSATEVFTSFIIGIYIASKIYAYVRTAKIVAYNSDSSTSSSKFNTHHSSHDEIDTTTINKISIEGNADE